MEKRLRILFIGNSHTYFNDMPAMVAERFRNDGVTCEVTMLTQGGWFLYQHVKEPEIRFNILYGHYDYVVLQEHSHPFATKEEFFGAVRSINEWIKEAGSKPVIYMTWSKKDEPFMQEVMNEAHEEIAKEIGALIAPVGRRWWKHVEKWPNVEMYYKDGAHASVAGSEYAAKYIWKTIKEDLEK